MKKPMTLQEHNEVVMRDSKFVAMLAEKERQMAELRATLAKDQASLIEELTELGWPDEIRLSSSSPSLWDLVNRPVSYTHMLNKLAEHVTKPHHNLTLDGIVRALAVKEARGTYIPQLLMNELKKWENPSEGIKSYRSALINTLCYIGNSSQIPDVDLLLAEPRFASRSKELERLRHKIAKRKPRQRLL